MINGKIGEFQRDVKRARGSVHPPVVLSGKIKPDQGVFPYGLVLSRDDDKKLIPYDPAKGIAGVLDEEVDTAATDVAFYIVHGSIRTFLNNQSGTVSSEELVEKLHQAGIYPEN